MITRPSKIITHARHLAPKKRQSAPAPAAAPKTVSVSVLPATWGELHLRTLGWSGRDDAGWLMLFGARIPGCCDCRAHWRQLLAELTPDFSNYFAWSVAAHNAVNRKLGKPELGVAQAQEIWSAQRARLPQSLAP